MKLYKQLASFTTVSNEIFEHCLSAKAIGIYVYLVNKPDKWEFSVSGISKQLSDGKSAIRTGLQELEDAGFLVREQSRQKGQFKGYDYTILASPLSENPTTDNPMSENRTQVNTNKVNTKKDINNINTQSDEYGNEFVNFVLAQFSDLTGFEPTDSKYRLHAWNLVRRSRKVLKQVGHDPQTEEGVRRTRDLISSYFEWLREEPYSIETMRTAYWKFNKFEGLVLKGMIDDRRTE